jgi:hypothetical protein
MDHLPLHFLLVVVEGIASLSQLMHLPRDLGDNSYSLPSFLFHLPNNVWWARQVGPPTSAKRLQTPEKKKAKHNEGMGCVVSDPGDKPKSQLVHQPKLTLDAASVRGGSEGEGGLRAVEKSMADASSQALSSQGSPPAPVLAADSNSASPFWHNPESFRGSVAPKRFQETLTPSEDFPCRRRSSDNFNTHAMTEADAHNAPSLYDEGSPPEHRVEGSSAPFPQTLWPFGELPFRSSSSNSDPNDRWSTEAIPGNDRDDPILPLLLRAPPGVVLIDVEPARFNSSISSTQAIGGLGEGECSRLVDGTRSERRGDLYMRR